MPTSSSGSLYNFTQINTDISLRVHTPRSLHHMSASEAAFAKANSLFVDEDFSGADPLVTTELAGYASTILAAWSLGILYRASI